MHARLDDSGDDGADLQSPQQPARKSLLQREWSNAGWYLSVGFYLWVGLERDKECRHAIWFLKSNQLRFGFWNPINCNQHVIWFLKSNQLQSTCDLVSEVQSTTYGSHTRVNTAPQNWDKTARETPWQGDTSVGPHPLQRCLSGQITVSSPVSTRKDEYIMASGRGMTMATLKKIHTATATPLWTIAKHPENKRRLLFLFFSPKESWRQYWQSVCNKWWKEEELNIQKQCEREWEREKTTTTKQKEKKQHLLHPTTLGGRWLVHALPPNSFNRSLDPAIHCLKSPGRRERDAGTRSDAHTNRASLTFPNASWPLFRHAAESVSRLGIGSAQLWASPGSPLSGA